jgi:hypothetical protein
MTVHSSQFIPLYGNNSFDKKDMTKSFLDFLISINLILCKTPVKLEGTYNNQELDLIQPTFNKLISIHNFLLKEVINFFSIRIYYRYEDSFTYSTIYLSERLINSLKFSFSTKNFSTTFSLFLYSNVFHKQFAIILINRYNKLLIASPNKLLQDLGKIYYQLLKLDKYKTSFSVYQLILQFFHFIDWKAFSLPISALILYFKQKSFYQNHPQQFLADLFDLPIESLNPNSLIRTETENKKITIFSEVHHKLYPILRNRTTISFDYFIKFFKNNPINFEKFCLTEPILKIHLLGLKYYIVELPPFVEKEKLLQLPFYIVNFVFFPDRTIIIGVVSTSKAHYIRRNIKKVQSIHLSHSLTTHFLQKKLFHTIPKRLGVFPAFEREFNFSNSHNYLKKVFRKHKDSFGEFKKLLKNMNLDYFSSACKDSRQDSMAHNKIFSFFLTRIPIYQFHSPSTNTFFVYIRILRDKKEDKGSLESVRDYIQIWGERVLVFKASNILYAKISFSKDHEEFFWRLDQYLANSFSKYIFDYNQKPITKFIESDLGQLTEQIFKPPIDFLNPSSYEYDFPAPSIKKMKNLFDVR